MSLCALCSGCGKCGDGQSYQVQGNQSNYLANTNYRTTNNYSTMQGGYNTN